MNPFDAKNMKGLVLTAGGARGAYQAGVLKRLGEMPRLKGKPSPFPIVAGASAGAINGTLIAALSGDFTLATKRLAELWGGISFEDVFHTDSRTLGRGALRWIRDLSMGGLVGGGRAQSLLDATPLKGFLTKSLPLDSLASSISQGHLYALGLSATSYYNGKSYTFVQGRDGHPLWMKTRRVAEPTVLEIDHVCASASIPIVFQPIRLRTKTGDYYFGDGSLRLVTPLSPAIRLGANRLFAVGIRSHASSEARLRHELLRDGDEGTVMQPPPLAQVFGVSLNAIFLDHLDADLEHLTRMNELLGASTPLVQAGMREPMRPIESMAVYPSQDLADVAERHAHRLPKVVRYFLEGLGASAAQSADLMSYLLFASEYAKELISIGYEDAGRQAAELEDYLS